MGPLSRSDVRKAIQQICPEVPADPAPEITWVEYAQYNGDVLVVGHQDDNNIWIVMQDRQTTTYVLRHELLHWCLWRITGDGDHDHTRTVWRQSGY